ncbi:hypothetical protein ZIOFF_000988 [Zingiber officinale]|uniref:K Homology domain-containing protein n=1 Tax=Zingiber officinale TaxID=94328 RepID=A0A8J5I1V8_ZINOF|nr:hypothetical protein ZIOFF_000988 [Zingiber officinale]
MESPKQHRDSSPDTAPRRSHPPRSPTAGDEEKQTHIRILVSNTAAGCIIGKGRSTISEFQSQSGARIQLSCNHEVFPGTSDRILLISGALGDVIKAMELVQEKLLSELEDGNDAEGRSKVRLIVPNSSCGALIGKGGSTIKYTFIQAYSLIVELYILSFIEESRAGIKISPQDNNAGLNDRLVTLTGSFEEQMRAIFLILSRLIEDAHYPQTLNSPYQYSGALGRPVVAVFRPELSGISVGRSDDPLTRQDLRVDLNLSKWSMRHFDNALPSSLSDPHLCGWATAASWINYTPRFYDDADQCFYRPSAGSVLG